MKVSLNTVRAISNVPVDEDLDNLVLKIGAQIGAVEEVIDHRPRYDRIVVARVVSCEKHPNADKLSVCAIDDGGTTADVNRDEQGYVQVVCGAPNVRQGLIVAWIPPGATVPTTYDNDPFVLDARELRGVVSNGMLASASELGISNDHSGLLEIDPVDVGEENTKPGTPFVQLYGLDDVIIDIENKMFTHRPDCFGVLGVAREIAGIYGKPFTSPEWYRDIQNQSKGLEVQSHQVPLSVENKLTDKVPRFMACVIDTVTIGPSPIWMQALLMRIGVKSINNIVDLTNYYSYLTAQPLHAYDYDKVAALTDGEGAKLVVRYPKSGEQVALLNGKTITPRDEAIMIATDRELIGVGGVMGGTSTEVDDNTKRIILECANFDMYSIRKTSMAHGLFTDAVTRFNKGQSALQNSVILSQVVRDILQFAGGSLANEVIDVVDCDRVNMSHDGWNDIEVDVSTGFVNDRLGLNLSLVEIKQTLKNVEFGFEDVGENTTKVFSPFWRTDIALPEDIVEEVGRLVGFDKLPYELPARMMSPTVIDPNLTLKHKLRSSLAAMGANELLTYSFVHGDLLQKSGQNPEVAFKIGNAISPELQYYRLSLTPNLLAHVHQNIKAGHDDFVLFEMGKIHCKSEIDEVGLPREFGRLGLVFADKRKNSGGYFVARAYVDKLLDRRFKIVPYRDDLVSSSEVLKQLSAPYDPARSGLITVNDRVVGIVGEFKMSVLKSYKLPVCSAGAELDLEALALVEPESYTPLSRYPGIAQDICFEVHDDVAFVDFKENLQSACVGIDDDTEADLSLIDIFRPENSDKKRYTFRIKFVSYDRTLQEKAIISRLDELARVMNERYSAVRI